MDGGNKNQDYPLDFSLNFHWVAASVPPPYHYEYQILLSASGAGEITFLPDYEQHHPPVLKVGFNCTAAEIEALHQMLTTHRLLQTKWSQPARHGIGGEQVWCGIVSNGENYSIPSSVTQKDALRIAPFYDFLKSLVPAQIWADLQLRNEIYRSQHS